MKNTGFAQTYLLIGLIILALIGGVYYWGKNSSDINIFPKSTQSVTPTSQPSQLDEIASWKTYTDTDYSFSFQYPEDWDLVAQKYDEGSKEIIFLDSQKIELPKENTYEKKGRIGTINIQVENYNRNQDFIQSRGYERFPDQRIGASQQIKAKKVEEITPGNLNQVKDRNKRYIGYVFNHGGKYFFNISVQTDQNDNQTVRTFNQVLSTFKFLDQDQADSSNWKTHTNKDNQYSFMLPVWNWAFEEREDRLTIYKAMRAATGDEFLAIKAVKKGDNAETFIQGSISPNAQLKAEGQVSVNGYSGEKWTFNTEPNDDNYAIRLEKGDLTFVIIKQGSDNSLSQSINEELNKIVSTFKFL